MLRNKGKGQGLVEFALILPLLLLLLLGIIEGARIIWAYITVQTSAREAARYAISGRPYLDANVAYNPLDTNSIPYKICLGEQPDPDPIATGVQPWVCIPSQRVNAVKEVALVRARTLAIEEECTDPNQFFRENPPDPVNNCADRPGNFGVLVRGQLVTETIIPPSITPTNVVTLQVDHPGTQGLNVEISTFYNVKMLDPIFDALMGGNFLRMDGRAVLQNEGIDAAIGILPPPPIDTPNPGNEIEFGVTPGTGYIIESVSGYTEIPQTSNLLISLKNHPQGKYDIYLDNNAGGVYKICSGVQTDGQNKTPTDVPCNLAIAANGAPVPPSPPLYDLVSTAISTTSPYLGKAPSQVQIIAGTTPEIQVVGGQIWAANSQTEVSLLAHQVTDEPFEVKLFDSNGVLVQTIGTSVTVAASPIPWNVPDMVALGKPPCDLKSGNPCTIKSYDKNGVLYTPQPYEVYINQPEIILTNGPGPYPQGQTLLIYLRGHTPNQAYEVFLRNWSPDPYLLGQTMTTNSFGDTTVPVPWTVPLDCPSGGLPAGFYDLESRPIGQSTQVALLPDLEITAPTNPYLTIDGGTSWPAGSFININLFKHPINTNHYLQFGTKRVPTVDSTDNDTFNTGTCGTAVLEYTIPITTAAGIYAVKSFQNAGNIEQASLNVQVTTTPYILVLQGNKVSPNATITIQLGNHAPNSGYLVKYFGNELIQVQTNGSGAAQFTYNLTQLSVVPPLGSFQELLSESTSKPGVTVAKTLLALQGADLAITKVEFPPNAASLGLNVTVPVTLTVKNLLPVSITNYFDTDFDHNPGPIPPSYLSGYNFPGDAKYWRNSVSAAGQPGDTFILTDTFTIQKYGQQIVYGFTDNRNGVYEAEQTGQVANPNNLGNGSFTVTCPGTAVTDSFSTNIPAPGPFPNWNTQRYNNADQGYGARIFNQQLYLNNDGSNNFVSNDSSSGGELYFHRTSLVTTTPGLDVIVKVMEVPKFVAGSQAGIEIRNSLNGTSPRVLLGLTWGGTSGTAANKWVFQPAFRDGGGTGWVGGAAGQTNMINNHKFATISDASPVWLRVVRVAGSDVFNFYYKQQVAKPTNWGASVITGTIPLSNQVYVGLYNSPYRNGTTSAEIGTARFDDFSYFPDLSTCVDNPPPPPPALPPGLQICSTVLQDRSFEDGSPNWHYTSSEGTARTSGSANSGLFKLLAPSENGAPFNPWFYQQFTMPSWVISSTTQFNLSLYINIDNMGNNQATDQFYAVVATSPNPATRITTPTVVAQGVMPGPAYDQTKWLPVNISLPVINKATLPSLAGQPLYLYLYNTSNSTAACGAGGCTTKFFFDDVNLSPCTTQPLPAPITTRIKGDLTLWYSDNTSEKLGYVKVWAYAEGNNQVYETLTLPNGEFNFYNLPATSAGIKYFIFAQYFLTEGNPPQLETLAGDTSVILKTSHTNSQPAQTFLNIYTLSELPGP